MPNTVMTRDEIVLSIRKSFLEWSKTYDESIINSIPNEFFSIPNEIYYTKEYCRFLERHLASIERKRSPSALEESNRRRIMLCDIMLSFDPNAIARFYHNGMNETIILTTLKSSIRMLQQRVDLLSNRVVELEKCCQPDLFILP